jgi:thiamine biosynthesis protein ThiS
MVMELAEGTITLTVNGIERTFPRGTSIAALLATLALDARMVVVEHNHTILQDRDTFGTRTLSSGDTLELVHFVGGG